MQFPRRFLLAIALLGAVSSACAQIPGLSAVDFNRYFPHLVAMSEHKVTSEFPNGVQYKFITVRDQAENKVVLALVKRNGGEVSRVLLARGPVDNSEATLRSTVDRLSKAVGLAFEVVDLRDVGTFEQFKARAESLGWGVYEGAQ